MNDWTYEFTLEAEKDLSKLDGSQRKIVIKAIEKVVRNPLPRTEGGLGEPLGNKFGYDLTGYNKIKLKGQNLRIVYNLINDRMVMQNIAIGERSDQEIYRVAYNRIKK